MITSIILLASLMHSDAQCKIPLYVETSTIPSKHKEEFFLALKDAITFWNLQSDVIGFDLIGNSEHDTNENAVTISWSADKGSEQNSIANTYLLTRSGYIKRARVNLLYQTNWCELDETAKSSCYDMTNSLEHELGHALGLIHTHNKLDLMKSDADYADNAIHSLSVIDKQQYDEIISSYACVGSYNTFMWR